MSSTTCDDLGKFLLRLTIGILILLHGVSKLSSGVGWLQGMLASQGWPAFFAWGVYLGEVLAPILIILGVYTRAGAALIRSEERRVGRERSARTRVARLSTE